MKFDDIIKSASNVSDVKKLFLSIDYSLTFAPWNYWLGIKILKSPLDLMILQEIMFEKKPDTIIECGTAFGGSALYMATLMDLMSIDGKIITIDRYECQASAFHKRDIIKMNGKMTDVDSDVYQIPIHPKITFIHSNCLTATIPETGTKTMVILDCDHSADHVYKELQRFSEFVTPGQYLIVEDTDAQDEEGGGPAAAIKRFLSENKNFKVDKSREKYGISTSLGGYLLRIL